MVLTGKRCVLSVTTETRETLNGKQKMTMMFRGRQVTHPELGLEVLSRVTEELVELGKVESHPNMEGRIMSMVIAPRKT